MIEESFKKELSQIVGSKVSFISTYGESEISEKIYNDIIRLVHEVVKRQTKMPFALRVISVYSITLSVKHPITIRELFYRTKSLFKTSSDLDRVLNSISNRLEIDISVLKVYPSYKGLVWGSFILQREKEKRSFAECNSIPRLYEGAQILTEAKMIIVLEKEAVFDLAAQEGERIERQTQTKVLLVTGKGYPCGATLKFLMALSHIKTIGIFDCDPYGMNIYKVYKEGSKRKPALKIPHIERVGVYLSDIQKKEEFETISTKAKEYALLKNLITINCATSKHVFLSEYTNDLLVMYKQKIKASIEIAMKYTTVEEYIIRKIKEENTKDMKTIT